MKKIKYIKCFLLGLNLIWFYIFIKPELYIEYWDFAWKLLILVLFIRPLSDLFTKYKFLKYWVSLRKELWILSWVFAITHVIWYLLYNNIDVSILFSWIFWSPIWYLWWWMYALIMTIILVITSNNYSMKLLKRKWKTIQRLSYLMFIFTAVHIAMINDWEEFLSTLSIVIVYIIIYTWAFLYKKQNKTILLK